MGGVERSRSRSLKKSNIDDVSSQEHVMLRTLSQRIGRASRRPRVTTLISLSTTIGYVFIRLRIVFN